MNASSPRHISFSACTGASTTLENGSALRRISCRRRPTSAGTSRHACMHAAAGGEDWRRRGRLLVVASQVLADGRADTPRSRATSRSRCSRDGAHHRRHDRPAAPCWRWRRIVVHGSTSTRRCSSWRRSGQRLRPDIVPRPRCAQAADGCGRGSGRDGRPRPRRTAHPGGRRHRGGQELEHPHRPADPLGADHPPTNRGRNRHWQWRSGPTRPRAAASRLSSHRRAWVCPWPCPSPACPCPAPNRAWAGRTPRDGGADRDRSCRRC